MGNNSSNLDHLDTHQVPKISKEDLDSLVHYLYEADLNEEQLATIKRNLLPDANFRSSQATNHALVTTDWMQKYAEFRALGMSKYDTAHALGITTRRLDSILAGDGLDPAVHKALLTAEMQADSLLKTVCLSVVMDSVRNGNWKASLSMLEKKFPEEFGRRQEIHSISQVQMSSEQCANKAQEAMLELQRMRDERIGEDPDDLYQQV